MANELVQGLLQGLLQPQQGPNPADIMTAISSRNPMAAVSAMQAPQLSQMFGQQFRGLVRGLQEPAPEGTRTNLNANEAYAASLQQLSAQPNLMNSSVGLAKMAQAASTVGRTAEAMQFSLMASQKKQEEELLARQTARQGLGVATSVNAITDLISSLDPQKDAKYIAELSGFANQVAAGVIPPDKVQSGITTIATRNKQEAPEVFQFTAEWDAWKQGQAQGADTSYPAFLTWKANLTRQDSEYQTWLKQNPDKSIEDFWKAKEAATSTPTAPKAVPTPTQNEEAIAAQWLDQSLRVPGKYWGTNAAVSTADRPRLAALISNEAAKIKAAQGGTFQDALTAAAKSLKDAGTISVDDKGNITVAAPSYPFADAFLVE
jgi:hypothetical protein